MKQCLSILMVLVLVFGSGAAVFADSAVPADVAGTRYEEAAASLIEKGVFTGYEDGAFHPENKITRAEVSVVLVKAMGASAAEMSSAAKNTFDDLADYPWAENYINYASAKGIINGYGDGSFRPDQNINFNEIVTILVVALGYDGSDFTGNWPESYINKAVELGILDSIPDSVRTAKGVIVTDEGTREGIEGSAPVDRGDVAIMVNNVIDKLSSAN